MYDFQTVRTIIEREHDRPQLVLNCEDCGPLEIRVLQSAAGFYLGTWCECGPMARFSTEYYESEEAVRAAVNNGTLRPKLWL